MKALHTVLPLALAILSSCSPPDFSREVRTLDSLMVQVDSSFALFAQVKADEIQNIIDSVDRHLTFIQNNYEGSMQKDMALHLSTYRSIRKLIPDAVDRATKAREEMALTKTQLNNLKTALTDGSTHDAAGNKLTADYARTLVAKEKEAASALIKEMDLISERDGILRERFDSLYPRVRLWVDSIQPKPLN